MEETEFIKNQKKITNNGIAVIVYCTIEENRDYYIESKDIITEQIKGGYFRKKEYYENLFKM